MSTLKNLNKADLLIAAIELEEKNTELGTALENSTKNVESLTEELDGTKDLLDKATDALSEAKEIKPEPKVEKVKEVPGLQTKFEKLQIDKRLLSQKHSTLKKNILLLIAAFQKAIK